MRDQAFHEPVMVQEILALLQIGPNQHYVDGTLGLGGHAKTILEKSSPEGRLLGIDRDTRAIEIATKNLEPFTPRVTFRHGTFDQAKSFIQEIGWEEIDGMILDLGMSSFQLEDEQRGFSFLRDSALDMRMDLEEEVTARELLNDLPEKTLETIFREFGEERFSKRIAQAIVKTRQRTPIQTTDELKRIVSRAVPFSKTRIHPATRVFQALRIAVNRELEILESFLKNEPTFLKVGGVMAILSYHSLEDRIVKWAFRSYTQFEILTKKPLRPQRDEVFKNPRARSAKLRAIKRIG